MTAPPSSASPTADPAGDAAEEYFDALYRADEAYAVTVVTHLLDSGRSGEEVLLRLVVPAQVQVGLLWQSGEWTIAQEHAATCIAERVVHAVGVRTRSRGTRGHVVIGCLDGEWHALPARIVGEVLRMHDWRVTFLGASVPPAQLVSFLHQHGPDVVALSTALPIHLPAAHRTIVAAQRTGTPVLVGGPGFGPDGVWARRLGVDAWAPTVADAVALLDDRPSWPGTESTAAADVPAQATGSEYEALRQRRGRLVAAAVDRLRSDSPSGVPALLSDSPVDDDIGHVAGFLAVAAYLGERLLFVDHVRWLAAVAAHRVGAARALPAVLDTFRGELHDFPFAQACLTDGAVLLTGEGAR